MESMVRDTRAAARMSRRHRGFTPIAEARRTNRRNGRQNRRQPASVPLLNRLAERSLFPRRQAGYLPVWRAGTGRRKNDT
jgi:hypothetical protein